MQYVIHSSKSPIECYMLLDAITDPASLFVELTGGGEFYGEVTKEGFRIHPQGKMFDVNIRGWRTTVYGSFQQTGEGTDIVVNISPPKGVLIPFVVFACIVGFGAVSTFVNDILVAGWGAVFSKEFLGSAACACCLVLVCLGALRPSKRTIKILNEIFK